MFQREEKAEFKRTGIVRTGDKNVSRLPLTSDKVGFKVKSTKNSKHGETPWDEHPRDIKHLTTKCLKQE